MLEPRDWSGIELASATSRPSLDLLMRDLRPNLRLRSL